MTTISGEVVTMHQRRESRAQHHEGSEGRAERTASATLAPGVPLTTNIDAWHAVHHSIAAGMTRGEIAARFDLSYQMVGNWSRMPEPPRRHPLGRTRGTQARIPLRPCCDCGGTVSVGSGKRCATCATTHAAQQVADRRAALRAWAEQHGEVPSIRRAQTITGLSRARAGELVIDTFGRDPMSGGRRLAHGPRTWPTRTQRIDPRPIG